MFFIQDHAFLNLIDFVFSKKLKRIEFVWYALTMGKFLKPEISHKDNERYEKDEEYYDYDIDELYTNVRTPLVTYCELVSCLCLYLIVYNATRA